MTGLAHLAAGAPRDARAVMAGRDPASDNVDFFPTPPWGARAGAELIRRLDPVARTVWEPACGPGVMAHGLAEHFPIVRTSDAFNYGGHVLHDFVGDAPPPFRADWIVTNPPFALLEPFLRRAWTLADRGVALLMRAAVLEGQGRFPLLFQDCPLTVFAPFSERLPMHKGRYDVETSTASFYAWFIFAKPCVQGARRLSRLGHPVVMPIPPGTRDRLFDPADLQFAAVRHD